MTTLDARNEIAHAPIGAFHWRFAVLMALIMLFDGYDLFNAAYVIPLVRKSWAPSPNMIGMMLSSGIVGLSVGSVVQGLLADRVGRRKVMIGALWLLTGCSVLLATAVDSPLSFAFCRLLLGIALGMVTPLMITCLNEFTPRRHANVFATWIFTLGFSMGGIGAGVAGITLAAARGWQSLYELGSMSIFVALAATVWMPESVQFAALKGRQDVVRSILSRVRPDRARTYATAQFVVPAPASRRSVRALLTPLYRRNTLVCWSVGFLSLFCIHGLTGWLPSIVVQRGEAVSSAFAYGTLVMVASVFGGMFMGWWADRLGSRIRAMQIAYLFASLSAIGLGFANSRLFTIALVACTGFFLFGAQSVLNNYQAMVYRTEVRGTGVGIAIGLNRVGGILGPAIIGLVTTLGGGTLWVFVLVALSLAVAAVGIGLGVGEIEIGEAPVRSGAEGERPLGVSDTQPAGHPA